MLPVRKVQVSPTLTFVVVCKLHTSGIGRINKAISVKILGSEPYIKKSLVLTQRPPGMVLFQKKATGLHWKIATVMFAMELEIRITPKAYAAMRYGFCVKMRRYIASNASLGIVTPRM